APHPFITRARLLGILQPGSGESLLEVGPGTGYYTLPVAEALGRGRLDIYDLQQAMLDHTMRRAGEAGINNIVPTQGDACELPFADERFDGAFLVTVLGEISDRAAALAELHRAIRPGGRLVTGEIFGDPHMVGLSTLKREAATAGFNFETHVGNRLAYFARLSRT
ncbi:MAG: class I SAM-dependent methyltransferase, partial [Actinomycetota bacterium]